MGAATSFVGREADLGALAEQLELGRVVTVVGPGGVGKTRLAQRFAEERSLALAERGASVWFCDLSGAKDVAGIVAAVVAALGLEIDEEDDDGSEEGACHAVGRAIDRRGDVLVVLDDFDRLVAHAWTTVGRWVGLARSARFLVTSRVALALGIERVWTLAPLPAADAVALFAQRANQIQPSFDLSREHATVGSIVEAIDRLPLAIELAAMRLSVLSATQLRERLDRPLDVLRGPREGGRQTSLRRTILDSVDLLNDDERGLFAACAQLRNGFTLEAAEAALGDVVVPRGAVLDGLSSLVRFSLVRVEIAPGDVARCALFETIRDVAEELPQPDVVAIRARFASYQAERARRSRRDDGSLQPLNALDVDQLVHAFDLAIALASAPEQATSAIEASVIALALEPALSGRGAHRACATLFGAALDALEKTGSDDASLGAQLWLARGLSRRELGDTGPARLDFERALAAALACADPSLAAVALTRLGDSDDVGGDTVQARARFTEALLLLAGTPPTATRARREGEAQLRRGHALRREGDLASARAAIGAAIAHARTAEDDAALAAALYEAAVIEMFAGAHDAAFAWFDEGLVVARRGEARLFLGALTTARGCLLQDLGRLDEALSHHAEAAAVFREAGSRYREGSATYYLASAYLERGEPAEAASILRRARACLVGVGAARYTVLIEGCQASVSVALGDLEAAESALVLAEQAAATVRNEPALATNLSLHRLGLALRRSAWAGAEDALRESALRVEESPSDDSRFALRVLRRAVLRATQGVTEEAPTSREVLVIFAGGSGFRAPGAPKVALPERSPLRRILEHLARRRIEAPGETVSLEDIVRAGWPGEKIGTDAALNRAYVALANLRKLGLRGLLLHGSGGYALSQGTMVRIGQEAE